DRLAVTCGNDQLTREQLRGRAARLARDLGDRGVQRGDFVTIALENSVTWYIATIAAWNLGAIPQPVSPRLPARELAAIIRLGRPRVVIGGNQGALDLLDAEARGRIEQVPADHEPGAPDDSPLPDVVSPAWKAPTSGGSTGRPK